MAQFSTLQIKASEYVDDLLDLGVPDYRLPQLPNLYLDLIRQKDLLVSSGLSTVEMDKLNKLLNQVAELCDKLSGYPIKQTMVQLDFNDNNTVVDESLENITIIDVGEIVISHPFFSLINFLWQMNKHHGLKEKDDLYQKLKKTYLKTYSDCFANDDDLHHAFMLSEVANILCGLVYQDRFIKACGRGNLMKHNHCKLAELVRLFIANMLLLNR